MDLAQKQLHLRLGLSPRRCRCHLALLLPHGLTRFLWWRRKIRLLFAVLGSIVGSQVRNNFLLALFRNPRAKGFVHLVYLGFPCCGGKLPLTRAAESAVCPAGY